MALYRARVTRDYDNATAAFVSCLSDDEWMLREDIEGTLAHEVMLIEQRILPRADGVRILRALETLRLESERGSLALGGRYEDVHEFIEARVLAETGLACGGKMHTGRSRNDQNVLDIRMKLRVEIDVVARRAVALIATLLDLADRTRNTVVPLYTHSQPAQLAVYAMYMHAYIAALLRDLSRLDDAYRRLNQCPLGACAVGGTRFAIDRARTAELLGFDGVVHSALDAVSSRDALLEVGGVLAVLAANLSRIAEDVILWSTAEYGYIEIADQYCSTSSVMPQKKNPCVVELVRGGAARVYGSLLELLTTAKGMPTGYNRDFQPMKRAVRDAFRAVGDSLEMLSGVFATLRLNETRLTRAVTSGFLGAVDLAEAITGACGLPFREAHTLVGELVRRAAESGRSLAAVVDDAPRVSKQCLGRVVRIPHEVVKEISDPARALAKRASSGGPSSREVARVTRTLQRDTARAAKVVAEREDRREAARSRLLATVRSYTAGSTSRRTSSASRSKSRRKVS